MGRFKICMCACRVSLNIGMQSFSKRALVKIAMNMSLTLTKSPFNTVYGHGHRSNQIAGRGFNKLESEENLGSPVEFRVLLKNKAKGFLPKSYFTLWWPFETLPESGVSTKRGKFLLYMVHGPRLLHGSSKAHSKNPVEMECDAAALRTLVNPIKNEFGFKLRVSVLKEYFECIILCFLCNDIEPFCAMTLLNIEIRYNN